MLADVGLRADRLFEPDDNMRAILTEAAAKTNEQLVVAAFADTAPERLVWPDRRWEWVVYSEGDFGYYERDFLNLSVRERWFYQATLETDKMFMHKEGPARPTGWPTPTRTELPWTAAATTSSPYRLPFPRRSSGR